MALSRTTKTVITVVVLGVVVYGIAVWLNREMAGLMQEDDRPPIIVNNGSIRFEAQNHSRGRGKWKADVTTAFWRHAHGGPQPEYFRVQDFSGSSMCAGQWYEASRLTLTYGVSGDYTMTIGADDVKISELSLMLLGGGTQLCPFDGEGAFTIRQCRKTNGKCS